ncbi:MAG: lysophospholipase [Acidimicrobiia bacterium]
MLRGRPEGALLFRRWYSPHPWAAVVMVHGLSEHSGRYRHVGAALAEQGLDTFAFDLVGHGISDGARTYVETFADYHRDVEAILSEARSTRLPVALLGHSLGGLIILDYVLSGRPAADLVMLSAPALDARVPGWKREAARVLSRIAPRLRIPNGIRGEQLSRDPSVGEAYFADPLVTTQTTTRLAAEMLAAMRRVQSRLSRLTLPTFVIHGGADTVVPPETSASLGEFPNVERILYPALRHEVLNEPEGEQVLSLAVTWLREQLGVRRPIDQS